MGAVTPGETLGTLYNIHVDSNKTKQHALDVSSRPETARREEGKITYRDHVKDEHDARADPPHFTCGT